MTSTDWQAQRQTAIHLLRSGYSLTEVAQRLNRPVSWVCKWRDRYEAEGWAGLVSRTQAPKHHGGAYDLTMFQAICQARSELEAEAATKTGLRYIGSVAIKAKLSQKVGPQVPSTATIERVLRKAGLVRGSSVNSEIKVIYPHLRPNQPLQLIQIDIVLHYLRGGQLIACFNAIDVVSRYPTGQAKTQHRSQEATEFVVHVWQEIGLSVYTQVDNEGCFSGGSTHPGVLGKLVRLALLVGTQLVFSPFYHPESNGTVERFHQDYDDHVWDSTELANLSEVEHQSGCFFADYRQNHHHSALKGQTPAQVHQQLPLKRLPSDFIAPTQKLPLTEGRIHFIRQVTPTGTVKVLNLEWAVPNPDPTRGVWVTLDLKISGATLRIYDAAPDLPGRTCLAVHPFPLKEVVQPRPADIRQLISQQKQPLPPPETIQPSPGSSLPVKFLRHSFDYTAKAISDFLFTIY